MAKFDPVVLQESADGLYGRASAVMFIYAVIFAVIGAGLGFVAASATARPADVAAAPAFAFFGGLIGLMIGLAIGNAKAFQYRLEAQKLLLQMEIEKNTRKEIQVEAKPIATAQTAS